MAVIRRFDWEHFQEYRKSFEAGLSHSRNWIVWRLRSQFQHLIRI